MAFFDELGKKISQAGQTAVQKTKEMADVAKLNSSISDEERKIEDNYREIGKLYDSLHGGSPEVDFAALIASIRDSEGKIAGYRQQIKDIKGVVCCEKCGAEVSQNASFCSACGAPMPVVKPAEAEETPVQPEAAAQPETPVQPETAETPVESAQAADDAQA